VTIHRGTRVKRIIVSDRRAQALIHSDGGQLPFDCFVAAVPWRHVRKLFDEDTLRVMPGLAGLDQLQPAPITAVHLWFDRPVTHLPDALFVGRLSQWVFNRGRQPVDRDGARTGYYYQVVISASYGLLDRKRDDVVRHVRRELAAVWPVAGRAELLRWRLVTNPEAVFSLQPGVNGLRPAQETPIPNLFLAGDWTTTGWPATMEGAVRSGYLAVQALLGSLGRQQRVLVPDLPRGHLARWLLG
jgi:uncharacterized protein with NAD-binding domain and iron-sulfur cluster